jgi:hypothetical protein
MSIEPERDIATEPRDESEHSSSPLMNSEAERRADIDEDRRRVRELDDGELGGEA